MEGKSVARRSSCSSISLSRSTSASTKKLPASLPELLGNDLNLNKPEDSSGANEQDQQTKSSPRLVQHCGPDCTITQRIVDKLLSRMMDLENERSELLAANRSWAVQFQFMKERYERKIKKLEERLKLRRSSSSSSSSNTLKTDKKESCPVSPTSSESRDHLDFLTHQAEVYKEDFLEERKARVRAHAQIEALQSELSRERKSRGQLASFAPQSPGLESNPVVR